MKSPARIFLLLVLQCCVMHVTALDVRDFTYTHLGTSEGLSSQRIYSLVQSPDGALWWSNKDGVERYNGVDIHHYRMGNPEQFSNCSGLIPKVILGQDSSLTAFDNKGSIYIYDASQDCFRSYLNVSELLGREVVLSDMLVTDAGIWLSMREGVYFLRDGRLTEVLAGVYTNTIVATRLGLAVCTREGVFGYPVRFGAVPEAHMPLPKLLPYSIECGYCDAENDILWLGGFASGLYILTPDDDGNLIQNKLTGDDICNPVRSICPYDASTMLVGIDGLGVYQVSRQPSATGKFNGRLLFDANDGPQGVLHGNGIYALVCDMWGNVVVGSYSGGIDIARPVGSTPALFRHISGKGQSLLNDHVNCVGQWPDGVLVMGTDNGLSMHNPHTHAWTHTCHGVVVLSLCLTRQGTMLASTYGKGVYEITQSGQAVQRFAKRGGLLRDDHVYKLLYDSRADLWMGCLDGDLVQLTAGGCRYYHVNHVQDIVELPDGRMAVGTSDGLMVVSPQTGEVHELDYSHVLHNDVSKFIYTLYMNDGRELWIGTDGGGIYVYDLASDECFQLTQDNGLPSNTVFSISKDRQGRVLAATDKGLAYICADTPGHAVNVNYNYGISREYSPRAVTILNNGNVLYGTTSGALIVDPKNLNELNYTARLTIRGVRCSNNDSELFNEQVSHMLKAKQLDLDYDQRTFDLYFECINLRNQFDISYRYKVGDGEWSRPFGQQYIRFTNLEPGTHDLLLRSVSRTCGAVLDEVGLTIVVGRPWWDSWWMWSVYAALILLLFYAAWRVYQLHTKYMRLVVSSLENVDSHYEQSAVGVTQKQIEQDTPVNEEAESAQFIEKVTRLVVENLSDTGFNIDCLCRKMAMSRTMFYIKLKTYTGNSPQDFIRIIRLERAAALLRNGTSVADTAFTTGFDNPKYFSTVFKKYFGVSPSKYC